MGRELKRVPMDFDWPIGEIWKGYLFPYISIPCTSCDQTGYNPATRKIDADWYAFDNPRYVNISKDRRYNDNAWSNHITDDEVEALVRAGRLWDLTKGCYQFNEEKNTWEILKGEDWVPCDKPVMPTAEAVNEWNKRSMGHDGINHGICVRTRAQRLGVYGECEHCHGEGYIWQSDEIKKLAEAWEPVEPPAGEGYQLWETTSEGSPTSPVFDTLDKLCEWCEIHATTFGVNTASKESWKKMLEDDMVVHQEGNVIFL